MKKNWMSCLPRKRAKKGTARRSERLSGRPRTRRPRKLDAEAPYCGRRERSWRWLCRGGSHLAKQPGTNPNGPLHLFHLRPFGLGPMVEQASTQLLDRRVFAARSARTCPLHHPVDFSIPICVGYYSDRIGRGMRPVLDNAQDDWKWRRQH